MSSGDLVDSDKTLEALLADAQALEKRNVATADTADEYSKRRQADDRSHIALIIIWLFAGMIGGLLVFTLIGMVSGFAWREPADFMLEALKTLVLPVLTLVLGFYFGSSRN